jgi:hypothetical protein
MCQCDLARKNAAFYDPIARHPSPRDIELTTTAAMLTRRWVTGS